MSRSADLLIAVSNNILGSLDKLGNLEYNKKGRKYKFVNNGFQRIREEDKHLIVYPEDLSRRMSLLSAYRILSSIGDGSLMVEYPDLCLSIIGVADRLELNGWYEEENSSVVNFKNSKYDPSDIEEYALEYVEGITENHIQMGLNIMLAAKLNFLHTDHHIGVRLDNQYMKEYLADYFGETSLSNTNVLLALKCFVHWGNIKGMLHCLEVPNILLSKELESNFKSFPQPPQILKTAVKERFPSGTSKYSLLMKALDTLSGFKFSSLLPYPDSHDFNLDWLYDLGAKILSDPIKYHLRSSQKNLCLNPVNLNDISQEYSTQTRALLNYISLLINTFEFTGIEYLLQNSKIPKLGNLIIKENEQLYKSLLSVSHQIKSYQEKNWEDDDIISRLYDKSQTNLHDAVISACTKATTNV